MSSENTIKTLSQSLCKFVDFSNGEIQSRSNRDVHEHHRSVRVSRLAKTRAMIDFTANSSISVWSATTNPLSALLSDKGLNIHEAHVFSTTDGYSLDVFVVDGWPVEDTKGLCEAMDKAIARNETNKEHCWKRIIPTAIVDTLSQA